MSRCMLSRKMSREMPPLNLLSQSRSMRECSWEKPRSPDAPAGFSAGTCGKASCAHIRTISPEQPKRFKLKNAPPLDRPSIAKQQIINAASKYPSNRGCFPDWLPYGESCISAPLASDLEPREMMRAAISAWMVKRAPGETSSR